MSQQYDPKSLTTIFFALLFGQIVFGAIVWFLTYDDASFHFDYQNIMHLGVPISALVLDYLGGVYYKSAFRKNSDKEDVMERLERLQTAHIVRFALTEGATLLLLVISLVDDNQFFLVFAILNILYFFTLRPKIVSFNNTF
jgi:hypothetical protein